MARIGYGIYPILFDNDNVSNSETERLITDGPNSNSQASDFWQLKNQLEELTCQVCYQAFDDGDKLPKVLLCGHCFCVTCLGIIITKPACSKCPNCKAEIKYHNSKKIPTNFALLHLVSRIKEDLEKQQENKFILEVNKCSEEGRTIFAKSIVEWNQFILDKLEREIEKRNLNKTRMNESVKEMKEKLEEIKEEMIEKEEDMKNYIKQIKELECLQSNEANLCIKLKDLLASTNKHIKENKVSDSISQLGSFLASRTARNSVPQRLFPQTLENLDNLCQLVPVYATTVTIETTLYGKIMVKDGRIFIFSFHHQKPEAQFFPFKRFISEFAKLLPCQVFLLLAPEEHSESIELVIEVDSLTRRGENFALLSSAIRMETYKRKTLEYSYNIFSSTTTYHLSSGPPPVVEGIKKSDNRTHLLEGLVYGMDDRNSFFGIAMDESRNNRQHRIGIVISGLQKLRENKHWKLVIQDCGFIL